MNKTFYQQFALLVFFAFTLIFSGNTHAEDYPLEPENAFSAIVERTGDKLHLQFSIAPDYYLYQNKTTLNTQPEGLLANITLPEGKLKNDPFLGQQSVYTDSVNITQLLSTSSPEVFTLSVTLQGCAERLKICYPPYTHTFQIKGDGRFLPETSGSSPSTFMDMATEAPSEQTIKPSPSQKELGMTLGGFFLAGLAMAFTACMYPLLPILTALIAGQEKPLQPWRSLLLAFCYVQGLALTYTAIGVTTASTGALLTTWLQQPTVILTFSLLMIAFALAMFGVWNMQLPSSIQTSIGAITARIPGGHCISVFVMGMLSALIIGPCVAPPLVIALGYIARTGDAIMGGFSLYSMALGMGLPLLIIGLFGGHILPKAGAWMQVIRNIIGVMMIALAISLATPFIPLWINLSLWGILATGTAIYLLQQRTNVPYYLAQIAAIFCFLLAVSTFSSAWTGKKHPLDALSAISTPSTPATDNTLTFISIKSIEDWRAILAQHPRQSILLDIYADWCVACKEFEQKTLSAPPVSKTMHQFVLVRADITQNKPEHHQLLKYFGLYGPPGIIIFNSYHQEKERIVGFLSPDDFLVRIAPFLEKKIQ